MIVLGGSHNISNDLRLDVVCHTTSFLVKSEYHVKTLIELSFSIDNIVDCLK